MSTEWDAEMAELEEELAAAPRDALPGLAGLVETMVDAHGIDLTRETPDEDEEADELGDTFLWAIEVADEVARGEDVAARDIARAIESLKAVYRYASGERRLA